MSVLSPWECEYVVAPVFDDIGLVGKVSDPFRLPIPVTGENGEFAAGPYTSFIVNASTGRLTMTRNPLPVVPHVVDSFKTYVRAKTGEGETGWQLRVRRDTYPDPKDLSEKDGGNVVIRPWERLWLVPGAQTLSTNSRTLPAWDQRERDTYTVSGVFQPQGEGDDNDIAGHPERQAGFFFEITDWGRLQKGRAAFKSGTIYPGAPKNTSHWIPSSNRFTCAIAQPDSRGKIFPRDGYVLQWWWPDPDSMSNARLDEKERALELFQADRWLVWRRDNESFGFIGTTDQYVGTGAQRRAVFTDPGIPPDFSDTPPIRRPEGSAYRIVGDRRIGWPGVSGRYAQRYVLGGYRDNPDELKFASPGQHLDFVTSTPGKDTDSFIRELASRSGTDIRHIIESAGLMVLTSGGEWTVGSTASSFNPSTANALAVGYVGCSHIPPIVIDDRVVFGNRPGTRLYSATQEQELGRIDVQELTTLAYHHFDGKAIRAMAWSDEERILFIALAKIIMACTYLPEAGIIAFSQMSLPGYEEMPENPRNTPSIRDIAVVRETFGNVEREARDVLHIAVVFPSTEQTTGRRTDLRTLRMPVRQYLGADLGKDEIHLLDDGTEVVGEVRTFSFSPQTRIGRDERATSGREYAGAKVGPEWIRDQVRPFVESNVASIKVAIGGADADLDHPELCRMSDERVALTGSFLPQHEPSVVFRYSGEAEHGEIYGCGVQVDEDDPHESGLNVIHIGHLMVWVPVDRRSVLSRNGQTGEVIEITADCREAINKNGRYILEWAWAEYSKVLFLSMSDGMLLSLTQVSGGFALAEHSFNHHSARDVAVIRSTSGTAEEVTEHLYVSLWDARSATMRIVRMPIGVRGYERDYQEEDADKRVKRTDEYVSSFEKEFVALVETMPLVPPDVYRPGQQQVSPEAVTMELYSDQPYPGDSLKYKLSTHGYGPAEIEQEVKAMDTFKGGPFYYSADFRARSVSSNAIYSGDYDYSVIVSHDGNKLLDIHSIALLFKDEET